MVFSQSFLGIFPWNLEEIGENSKRKLEQSSEKLIMNFQEAFQEVFSGVSWHIPGIYER